MRVVLRELVTEVANGPKARRTGPFRPVKIRAGPARPVSFRPVFTKFDYLVFFLVYNLNVLICFYDTTAQ